MNDRRPVKLVQKVSFLCCQFCSYKTRFTGNLAKHIRTHTGERPFECQFCGKRFASKSNYNTHVVIHSPGGTSSLKIPQSERRSRLHRSLLQRQFASDVNTEVVRSVPMVKTLLSSSRSLSRSAVQQLSPIGSFLLPDRMNSGYSHTALYSSLNFSQFGTSLSNRVESLNESTSSIAGRFSLPNNEGSNVDDATSSPEIVEVSTPEGEGQNLIIDEDVKPSIFNILSVLPNSDKTSFVRKARDVQQPTLIKEETIDGELEPAYVENAGGSRSGRRRRKTGLNYFGRDSDVKNFNGDCSRLGGIPGSPMRSDEDPSQLHTQMLIDTLIRESRLYRCEPCNILFPDYSMYVLHLGCHGNESVYQCHFCRQFFDDRFSFATHFIRCPHDQSGSQ